MFAWLVKQLCPCRAVEKAKSLAGGPEAPGEAAPGGEAPTERGADERGVPQALAPLLEINGIGPKTVQHLHDGGYTTVDAVRAADEDDLAAIEGVGRRAAITLKQGLAGGEGS
ncbi:Helix-hairpin-helix domain-containing protein [Limimonas halophila]|uniref:Helix-hairpin-helix domain-containing protein n=1 Tax=Limimonas halophila TaxID=1082479 RepID=A0A1G7LAF3_9PROT|nr:helix-hairpin-helix domain-containing protein [Limimonas halophila]SDF46433.1 Helix-hairpin-helix domain-containing protein [Limimonas halophila]